MEKNQTGVSSAWLEINYSEFNGIYSQSNERLIKYEKDYEHMTPLKGSNYIAGQEKLGNYYSIHNNLPYAEPLANGHSPQADAGWVDLISKEMQAYVRSQYEKIKKF